LEARQIADRCFTETRDVSNSVKLLLLRQREREQRASLAGT
jgi:hypothetical protein